MRKTRGGGSHMKIYWKYGPAPACIEVPDGSRINFIATVAFVVEPNGAVHKIPIDYITAIL
jgi:hypothetical protein